MDEFIKSRQWMYNRVEYGYVRDEFFAGLENFIAFAVAQDDEWKDGDNIRCPDVKICIFVFQTLLQSIWLDGDLWINIGIGLLMVNS